MRKEIEHLLKRNVSSTQISLESGVNKTTIIKLRNGSRSLDNIKFVVTEKLYLYELKMNGTILSEEDIEKKLLLQENGVKEYLGNEISRAIKIGREKRRINTSELSSISGISQHIIIEMEKGTYNPTLNTIDKLFNSLNLIIDANIHPKYTKEEMKNHYHYKSKLK